MNGDLDEEVYMHLPLGYPSKGEKLVCKVNKSLYGLRQASKQWYTKFSNVILSYGFAQSPADTSLFIVNSGADLIVLLVYVDELLIVGHNLALIDNVERQFQALCHW